MPEVSFRGWRTMNNVLSSPRFPDTHLYDRNKKFFIRNQITAEYDDINLLIRININPSSSRNRDILEELGLL